MAYADRSSWRLSSLQDLVAIEIHLPFNLDLLPPESCLVGGAVRDAILKRQRDYFDLDFVLPEKAIETARQIAQLTRAGFVILDQERQIARVVFPQGTVDFALQEGENLEKDLKRRDFTINAIAYNFHTNQLIDPYGGLADLDCRIIRMISLQNLVDDPLRLLRAYRQAAQLNLMIEPCTHQSLRLLAPLLKNVAAERVQSELSYLLSSKGGETWLVKAWHDGILQPWLSNITPEKLEKLCELESRARQLQAQLKCDSLFDADTLKQAKLACLLSSISNLAQLELKQLKCSRDEIRTITNVLDNLPRLQAEAMSLREKYFFFLALGQHFRCLAILGSVLGGNQKLIFSLLEHYLDPSDLVAHPRPLITGHDLIKALKLSPGPQIGELLTEVQVAQIEGKITTREQAITWAGKLSLALVSKKAHQR